MKWYFCIESAGFVKFAPYIQAAVLSCRKHTDLTPVCLLHEHDKTYDRTILSFLKAHDVKVIKTRSRVYRRALRLGLDAPPHTAGTHLRYEIPLVEQDEEFVLYTDCDVLFNGPVQLGDLQPRLFAAGPEFHPTNYAYFNSGIMLMNVEEMRRTADDLLTATLCRMKSGFPTTHDQADLNGFYFEQWDRLPAIYNWKPYWGEDAAARIIHFHGPKPADIWIALAGGHPDHMVNTMVGMNPAGCRQYIIQFLDTLAHAGWQFSIDPVTRLGQSHAANTPPSPRRAPRRKAVI